ncbi:TolC family protein [Methylobacterium organophilum]|uniref:TolC family protein n=1 Tax=Methylobacterium organophilum TaxID=410 RepID=UPI001F12E80D|nr:TolC family protein [Methylobacterium organophilum]UMY18182.1 TolC family protein [Methylobacterium organophilum]
MGTKPAKQGSLTVPETVRLLIRENPDIGIAAAREKEAFAAIDGARASLLPSVDLSTAVGPQRNWETHPAGNAIRREAGVSIRQSVYDFGAAASNIERAALSYDSSTKARIAKTEQTVFDMLDLLMKVEQIDENIHLTKRNIKAHETILDIIKTNESNGNSTVADIKRVTTRLDAARTALIDLVTDRTNAADAFRRLTAMDVDRIADTVTPRLKDDVMALDDGQLDRNPEILAIQYEISSLREQLHAAELGLMPNVGIEAGWRVGRQMTEPDTTIDRRMYGNVLLSIRMPILDGGANTSLRQQIAARLEAATLKLDKRRRELREDAQGASRITSSDQDKSGTLASRVAAARKVQDLSLEQFRNGGRTVFELLDSQVDLVKAEQDLIAQTYARRRAQIRFLLLNGTLVSRILSSKTSI